MPEEEAKPRVDGRYALAQLMKALAAAGPAAAARVRKWQRAVGGLLEGVLKAGSRTPVDGAPPWVTLEVLHGGFATGGFAAGGPLQPHERRLLERLGRPEGASGRAALNLHFLGDDGRAELSAMLADGRFRVQAPEEGALLAAAWLVRRGEPARAERLLEAVMPFFDRLRFYPLPHPRPLRTGTSVCAQTVGEAVALLREKRRQPSVERMNESIRAWLPLYDRAASLFLETVEGDIPHLRAGAGGELVRRDDGQPIVEGGWPCRRYPDGWADRARSFEEDFRRARAAHALCRKPEKRKEGLALLRKFLARAAADPKALTGRDVGMVRKVLASFVTRHGAPGDGRHQATRAEQARAAARPTYAQLAGALARRLEGRDPDEGAPDAESLVEPLSREEAAALGAAAGEPLPERVRVKGLRCLEAPLEALIEKRVVPSSDAMAALLPKLAAQSRAEAIRDPELRRLYQAVYVAFRRRRSVLLLDLASQVKLRELPWLAALEPWTGADEASRRACRVTLERAAGAALGSFPHAILPNKLITELSALAAGAGLPLPFVEELACDIFMGEFSEKFLRAAQAAARLLQGTLYERYYGLPYELVLRLDDVPREGRGARASPGFAALCHMLAGAKAGDPWSAARNGTIIEAEQLLTTHNLALLFDGILSPRSFDLPRAARACFERLCAEQKRPVRGWKPRLRAAKSTAYAWRQMVFFLSLCGREQVADCLEWSGARLKEQGEGLRRLEPALAGLRAVAAGERFDAQGLHPPSGGRRLLGWTTGRHWLLPAGEEPEAARG